MADLSNILGGPWSPPVKHVDSPENQLILAISAAGLEPPDHIEMDGNLHRFRSGSKGSGNAGDKSGWYVVFGDGVPAGRFGCWRMGFESPWRPDIGRQLSAAEEMAHTRRMTEAKTMRDIAIKKQHEIASTTVEKIWSEAQAASAEHPYLKRKGIQPHGARITGDGRLIVPLFDQDGKLTSLQYIDNDSGKLYHPGGEAGGKFWMIGTMDEPGTLYVAEGFATAATIHEITGRPCVVAYSASSLVPVTGILREKFGQQQAIVIVADHDLSGTGQKYADQACAKYGARVVMPSIAGMDANDYAQAGHDLAGLLAQTTADWLIHADDFSAQPAPIAWLVKRWLQANALIMVHGPSGSGKTFVVLDWCLRIASGGGEWGGHKVKHGNVVYLAGEGHHGLRGRIAAWKKHNNSGAIDMWLSKNGCNLNTPAGYLQVIEQVRGLPKSPDIIVVDTLHRFLLGDENSAQDAKIMLDACNSLMTEFGCSVILVHHTGVSDEAQHRARGSSAWRGALDIEISIVPGKTDQPMQIVQRKSKDSEIAQPVYVELQMVTIPGWYDEDGQPVTSAVVVEASAPAQSKKDSKIDTYRKIFENAWWGTGAEEREGLPYISRSALKEKLSSDGRKPRTIENDLSPSYPDKLIGALILAEIISPLEHGWIVVDSVQSSAMIMRKGG